jgi:hypothetical protein
MRSLALAALTIALTTVAARANSVIASFDYGPFSESSSTINSITVSLGIAQDDDYITDPGTVQLLNVVIPTTTTGNLAYTITNSDPNWTTALALLNDGAYKMVSPIVELGNTGLTESMTVDEFNDNYYSYIFSSPAVLTATPITSIEVDLTNLQFTKSRSKIVGDSIDDITVKFYTGSPTVAAPLPAAFPAGALLLTGLAATTLHSRKRRPA